MLQLNTKYCFKRAKMHKKRFSFAQSYLQEQEEGPRSGPYLLVVMICVVTCASPRIIWVPLCTILILWPLFGFQDGLYCTGERRKKLKSDEEKRRLTCSMLTFCLQNLVLAYLMMQQEARKMKSSSNPQHSRQMYIDWTESGKTY